MEEPEVHKRVLLIANRQEWKVLIERCNVAHQECIGFKALSATRLRIRKVDLRSSYPTSFSRESTGCFLMLSLRLGCA